MILLVATSVWLLIPVAFAIGMSEVQDRWILQDTPRIYVAMAMVTLTWLALGALLVWGILRSLSPLSTLVGALAAMVAWSALAGWYAGPVVVNLANSGGLRIPAHGTVQLEVVEQMKQLVRLRPLGGMSGSAGITFTCSRTRWIVAYERQRPMADGGVRRLCPATLRKGRLGLWWAELQ